MYVDPREWRTCASGISHHTGSFDSQIGGRGDHLFLQFVICAMSFRSCCCVRTFCRRLPFLLRVWFAWFALAFAAQHRTTHLHPALALTSALSERGALALVAILIVWARPPQRHEGWGPGRMSKAVVLIPMAMNCGLHRARTF